MQADRVAPQRIIENLGMLRDALAREAFACSGLHHALVAINDDLSLDAIYSPGEGIVQQGTQGKFLVDTATRGPLEVISSDNASLLQSPEWTDRGKEYKFDPMTIGWNPEARREFIAKPGVVANGYLLAKQFDRETEHRRERFKSLTSDAMSCLDRIGGLPQLSSLCILDRLDPKRESDGPERWMQLVHRMGWEGRDTSLVRASRHVWLRSGSRSMGFCPHDSDQLKAMMDLPPFQSLKGRMAIPPDRFISELGHDVFTESAYAIDDILSLALGDPMVRDDAIRQVEPPAEARPRDSVFVSYSHGDRASLEGVLKMMSPAIRNNRIDIWHDKKMKPGSDWRNEIARALKSARIGLLLVTENFLDSDFINDEELPYLMEEAAKGGVEIFWISVRHCMHEQTDLDRIQCINDPAKPLKNIAKPKRDEEMKRICGEILEHYRRLVPARDQGPAGSVPT